MVILYIVLISAVNDQWRIDIAQLIEQFSEKYMGLNAGKCDQVTLKMQNFLLMVNNYVKGKEKNL